MYVLRCHMHWCGLTLGTTLNMYWYRFCSCVGVSISIGVGMVVGVGICIKICVCVGIRWCWHWCWYWYRQPASGNIWHHLAASRSIPQDIAALGSIWQHLGWQHLVVIGIIWGVRDHLAASRSTWQHLEIFGSTWQHLAALCSIWDPPAAFGSIWHHQAASGTIWVPSQSDATPRTHKSNKSIIFKEIVNNSWFSESNLYFSFYFCKFWENG